MAAIDALAASGLNAFLMSDVGTEANGLPLTVLSIMARLGHDPWVEAERLAGMPKEAARDCLAQSIRQVRPGPDAQAQAIAVRLVGRLPVSFQAAQASDMSGRPALHEWVPIVLFLLFLVGGGVASLVSAHPSAAVAGDRVAAAKPLIMPVSPLGR